MFSKVWGTWMTETITLHGGRAWNDLPFPFLQKCSRNHAFCFDILIYQQWEGRNFGFLQISEGAGTWHSPLLIPNGRLLLHRPEFLPSSIYFSFRDAEEEGKYALQLCPGKGTVWLWVLLFSRMLRKIINCGSLLARKKHQAHSWVSTWGT